MVDIKPELVSALKTATSWDVVYELVYKPGTVPAITYKEIDDSSLLKGDTINYSTLRYEIKVWANTMAQIVEKSKAIDTALSALGWTRYSSFETSYNSQILKVMRYVAIGYDEV